jgi:hypothetical protein
MKVEIDGVNKTVTFWRKWPGESETVSIEDFAEMFPMYARRVAEEVERQRIDALGILIF